MAVTARIYIGTQGWSYSDWSGPFYPEGTPSSKYLDFYARAFSAVEVDSSFYAIPPASHFLGWDERTPAGFRFALKLPGELTHERRLRGGDEVLKTFCKRAELLQEKLGAILVQLPPDFTPAERDALDAFVKRLPRDVRFAVEFRHPDWLDERTYDVLRAAEVGHALSAGPWIPLERVMDAARRPTAKFSYFRWLGDRPHLTGYTHTQIDRSSEIGDWAELLVELSSQMKGIYGFFNNHYEGHSPASARRLLRQLGQPVTDPDDLNPQLSLF
ncbi:MAG: DUF72 domain-containing protein [Gemmatimonadota bacterium]|nr:MAG: DUF72 domain-containing protein [Gemmatimonadota bacterium]